MPRAKGRDASHPGPHDSFQAVVDSSVDLWLAVNNQLLSGTLHDSEGGEKSANQLGAKKMRQG
jgi:hypothetical protein